MPRSHPIALNWHAVLVRFDLLFICLQQRQWRYIHLSAFIFSFVMWKMIIGHTFLRFFQMPEWQTNRHLLSPRRANERTMCASFSQIKSGVNRVVRLLCLHLLFSFISVWILVTTWACNCNDVVQHSVRYHRLSVTLFYVSCIRFFSFRPNIAHAVSRVLHIPSWLMF